MDQVNSVPHVAFAINLGPAEPANASVALRRHLVHLIRGHRLPATWIVEEPDQADFLHTQQAPAARSEFALAVHQRLFNPTVSHTRFRSELLSRLTALRNVEGQPLLVVGDPKMLRSRASVLADCHVDGILPDSQSPAQSAKPRPFPCGIWQLASAAYLPQTGFLARWLGTRRISVKQLTFLRSPVETILVTIEAERLRNLNGHGLKRLEKLLGEVSWAASRNQLLVSTTGDMLTELIGRRTVRPQRSILREAA